MMPCQVGNENHHVLVTGGTGFLGGHIVNALIEQHPTWRVSVMDIAETQFWDGVDYHKADVTNSDEVLAVVQHVQPTIIVHTAGYVPGGHNRYSQTMKLAVYRINVDGTANVLDAAQKCGIKYFVLTSSVTGVTDDVEHNYPNYNEDTPLGNATLIYGQSKAKSEQLVLKYNNPPSLSTCAIRPSVIIGPGDYQFIPTVLNCIPKFETPFAIGGADNLYDFAYVTNIADAHVLAIENLLTTGTAAGEAFIISNGEPVPFRDFCKAVWAHFGHVPYVEISVPYTAAYLAGLAAECMTWLTGKETTITRGSVKDYTQTAYADLGKAREILGYRPRVGLVEGLRLACEDYKASQLAQQTSRPT